MGGRIQLTELQGTKTGRPFTSPVLYSYASPSSPTSLRVTNSQLSVPVLQRITSWPTQACGKRPSSTPKTPPRRSRRRAGDRSHPLEIFRTRLGPARNLCAGRRGRALALAFPRVLRGHLLRRGGSARTGHRPARLRGRRRLGDRDRLLAQRLQDGEA